ncbi:MAG: hypothetical protein ACLFV4_06455 [Candidatus Hydrogenedentota bacterium]
MASGKGSRNKGESLGKVQDYRHGEAKRPNIPPAKLAAEGQVPLVGKVRYAYNPHRPPALRWHPDGEPDQLPELLEAARKRPLTDEEARTLNEALRHQQPWLEWAEKREQHERGDFEVDPVALHIHERVSAQAILKAAARQDPQRELFADPELDYHEAVQFYRHQMDWANRLILGDSLQVMSSLAQREDLAGKVQMIYMTRPTASSSPATSSPKSAAATSKTRIAISPANPRWSRPTGTPGISAFTPTSPTCATASSSPGNCSPIRGVSSYR